MKAPSQAIEATLFFRRTPNVDLPALASGIAELCRKFAPDLGWRPAGLDDVALAGPKVSLVVSQSGPLDLADFADFARPSKPSMRLAEVAFRLHCHGAALSVRANAEERERALCLCYAGTAALLSKTDPDLVHWRASETLYALPEFMTAAGAGSGPARRAASAPPLKRTRDGSGAARRLPRLAPAEPVLRPQATCRKDRLERLMTRGVGVGLTTAMSGALLLDNFVAGFKLG